MEKHQEVKKALITLHFYHVVLERMYVFSIYFPLKCSSVDFFRHNLLDSKINTLLSLCQDPLLNPIHGIVQSVVYHESPHHNTKHLTCKVNKCTGRRSCWWTRHRRAARNTLAEEFLMRNRLVHTSLMCHFPTLNVVFSMITGWQLFN